jgi:bifunctional NMN adenylyltransferase/nudix hydrolase
MSKKYAIAVVIGRMQPIHNGHVHLLQRASELADFVLVLFGDTGGPRTIKNPFTTVQRGNMLDGVMKYIGCNAYSFAEILDDPNDQVWIQNVNLAISGGIGKICIVGHTKEDTSYLEWFPQYDFINVPYKNVDGFEYNINATYIRDLYFQNQLEYVSGAMPESTVKELRKIAATPQFQTLKDEYAYIRAYRKAWEVAPYPVVFSTADAVVIQSGHVLLVRRGKEPGKGLLALPGGFLDPNETLFHASLRELREETGIKIQDEVLTRCFKAKEIFDAPSRSLRGRTITTAFLFKLNDSCELPALRPGKDPDGGTIDARWVPLGEVKRSVMFEDHYFIIQKMVSLL